MHNSTRSGLNEQQVVSLSQQNASTTAMIFVRRILLAIVVVAVALIVYGFGWFPMTAQTNEGDYGDQVGVMGTHPEGNR
jgi:hypothetical protein